jgi:hypothetical protein
VKVRPPKLAVGDAAQAQVLLELDDAANRLVFYGAQCLGVDRAIAELLTRIEQELRAQETADLVGAKRRRRADAGAFG